MDNQLTTPLNTILNLLPKDMVRQAWVGDNEERGKKVEQFRRYADGDHDANMTAEMRALLRINSTDRSEFTANHCNTVISMMADRCTLSTVQSDNDTATEWADTILDQQRIDGFQMDVHEAAIREGDTYVMVAWDNEKQQIVWTHEPAWTPTEGGLLVIYESSDSDKIKIAIKTWYETRVTFADTQRINIYSADRILKFEQSMKDGTMKALPESPFVDRTGKPLGVPIVAFCNRKRARHGYGLSELENVIPLQDTLNRLMHSMVATAELSGFSVLKLIGARLPVKAYAPGMIITLAPDGLPQDVQPPTLDRIEGSGLDNFIQALEFIINQIYDVSKTPATGTAGLNASGEALKQREIGLLGKVKRFQVKAGNSWEDCMVISHKLQGAFSAKQAPTYTRFTAIWEDAEIRNDKVTVETVMLAKDVLGEEQTLRQLANVFNLDEDTIQSILESKRTNRNADLAAIAGNIPMFTSEQPQPNGNGANAGQGSPVSINPALPLPAPQPLPV